MSNISKKNSQEATWSSPLIKAVPHYLRLLKAVPGEVLNSFRAGVSTASLGTRYSAWLFFVAMSGHCFCITSLHLWGETSSDSLLSFLFFFFFLLLLEQTQFFWALSYMSCTSATHQLGDTSLDFLQCVQTSSLPESSKLVILLQNLSHKHWIERNNDFPQPVSYSPPDTT